MNSFEEKMKNIGELGFPSRVICVDPRESELIYGEKYAVIGTQGESGCVSVRLTDGRLSGWYSKKRFIPDE